MNNQDQSSKSSIYLIKNKGLRIFLNSMFGLFLILTMSFLLFGPSLNILYSVDPQSQCQTYMKHVLIEALIYAQDGKVDKKITDIVKQTEAKGIPHSKFERYRNVVRAHIDGHYNLKGVICLLAATLLFINTKYRNKFQLNAFLGSAGCCVVLGLALIYFIEIFSPWQVDVSNEYVFLPQRTIKDIVWESTKSQSLQVIGYCKYCEYADKRTVVSSDGSWKVMSVADINKNLETNH